MNIPFGFRLKTVDFESFREELNKEVIQLALNALLSEYLVERFNVYNENETKEKNILEMRNRYEEILIDIKKVEENGFRNFSIPDVLTKIIYLKKDGFYYGIIDADELKIKDFFFNHKDVEHFTPNAWDISDEEIQEIKVVWKVLLPSLLDRSGDYFVLEDNVFIYPSFDELIKYIQDIDYYKSDSFYKEVLSENVFSLLLEELENKTKKEKNVEIITYELLNKRAIVNLLNNKASYNEGYFKENFSKEFDLFKVKYKSFIEFFQNI